jgi:UPF0716 protein FxsA
MQARANEGAPVGQEIGGMVLGFLGGLLLIIPGFLTDLIGLALLIRPIQLLVWPRYGRQMAGRMPYVRSQGSWRSPGRDSERTTRYAPGNENQGSSPRHPTHSGTSPHGPSVIVEGEVVDDRRSQASDQGPDDTSSDRSEDNPWAR